MTVFLIVLIVVFMITGVVELQRARRARNDLTRPIPPTSIRRLETAGLIPPTTDRS